jgi:DNA polymerase-3 subunit epsilon/ATP-dependent DNA helicase DinG
LLVEPKRILQDIPVYETFVSLDLETTGLDPSSDDIIEIGAVKFCGDDVVDTFHTMVNSYRKLPYHIQILTGITNREVETAPPLAAVLDALISFLGDYPIIGQSIAFDLGFLSEKGVSFQSRIFDTFELATILLPTLPDYRLSVIAKELGIHSSIHHRALADATLAKDVFLALLDKARSLHPSIIAELDRLSGEIDWPLAYLFRQISGQKLGDVFAQVGELPIGIIGAERAERLIATPERKLLDLDELTRILGSEGLIAQSLSQFEYRPEQVTMMHAVGGALNEGSRLIVEAGTGTGKSIAYLLPAIFFSLENGVPVVISTNTINLQEQLISKDIPDLVRALEQGSLRYTQLKGRNNYLCLRRWNLLRRSQTLSMDEVKLLLRTLVWLATTSTGDRAELGFRGDELSTWSRVNAQGESCLGVRCPYQKQGHCFLYHARRKAEGAHLIIANHALLLSEIATGSNVLPEYNHVIIDEAHHLEEDATEQWGFEVRERDVRGYLNLLSEKSVGVGYDHYNGLLFELNGHFRGSSVSPSNKKEVEELAQSIRLSVEHGHARVLEFFDILWRILETHAEGYGGHERRLRLTKEVYRQPEWSKVALAEENLSLALTEIDSGLNRLYAMIEPLSDILDHENLIVELSSIIFRGGELRQRIKSAVYEQGDGENEKCEMIFWLSLRGDTLALCAAPLHVGQVLQEYLFSRKECAVLTSATLSTEGHFEYIKGRLGLEDTGELLLGSSFDYMNAALVYIPDDIPDPGRSGYQQAVERVLIDLCRTTGGRTLALFTSHAALRASVEAIRTPLQEEDILVLGQGLDGSPRQLLQAFKANPRAVLLGTASFWEGIDIVGESLSVLVMARLPFSVPTDPVFLARSELFDDPFNEYTLPQTVLRFKQGFGRLIRTRSDRGVIVVLDRRIQSKYYGAAFLGSVPRCMVRSGPSRQLSEEVAAWLDGR